MLVTIEVYNVIVTWLDSVTSLLICRFMETAISFTVRHWHLLHPPPPFQSQENSSSSSHWTPQSGQLAIINPLTERNASENVCHSNATNRIWLHIVSDISSSVAYFTDLILCYKLREANCKKFEKSFPRMGTDLAEIPTNQSQAQAPENGAGPNEDTLDSNQVGDKTSSPNLRDCFAQPNSWMSSLMIDIASLVLVLSFSIAYDPLASLVIGRYTDRQIVSTALMLDTSLDYSSKYEDLRYNSSSITNGLILDKYNCIDAGCWEFDGDSGLGFSISRGGYVYLSENKSSEQVFTNYSIFFPLDPIAGYASKPAYSSGFVEVPLFKFRLSESYNYFTRSFPEQKPTKLKYESISPVSNIKRTVEYTTSALAIDGVGTSSSFGVNVTSLLVSRLESSTISWTMSDTNLSVITFQRLVTVLSDAFPSIKSIKYYSVGSSSENTGLYSNNSTSAIVGCHKTLDGLGVCNSAEGFENSSFPALLDTTDGIVVVTQVLPHDTSVKFVTLHVTSEAGKWYVRTSEHIIILNDPGYQYGTIISNTANISSLDRITFGCTHISASFNQIEALIESNCLSTILLSWSFVTKYHIEVQFAIACICTGLVVTYIVFTSLLKLSALRENSTTWSFYRECALPNCVQMEGARNVDKVKITLNTQSNVFHYGLPEGPEMSRKEMMNSAKLIE